MNMSSTPEREHSVLGQKYAFATVSMLLGIASFINLLGLEKDILAIVFGWLALRTMPGPVLAPRRRWAKSGIVLGFVHVMLVAVILIVARDTIGRFLERLGDLGGPRSHLASPSPCATPSFRPFTTHPFTAPIHLEH